MLDFHTHKTYNDGTLFVKSLCTDETPADDLQYFTIGIHPWSVAKCDIDKALEKIKTLCRDSHCLAIGEIGLDKLKPHFDLQLSVFELQIKLARELDKPIVIHAIRSYNEILQLRKKYPDGAWAIHGFNGSTETARQLADKNIFLSIGALLLKPGTKIAKTFPHLPPERIFLETDTAAIHIRELYDVAKQHFHGIEQQILRNFSIFAANKRA